MARASGTERASRSSFGTTRVSPRRTAASAWSSPGLARLSAGEAVIDVDPVCWRRRVGERRALGGEVLFVGGAARIADAVSLAIEVYV